MLTKQDYYAGGAYDHYKMTYEEYVEAHEQARKPPEPKKKPLSRDPYIPGATTPEQYYKPGEQLTQVPFERLEFEKAFNARQKATRDADEKVIQDRMAKAVAARQPQGLGIDLDVGFPSQQITEAPTLPFQNIGDGKFYTPLEPGMAFDTMQEALDRHRSIVYIETGVDPGRVYAAEAEPVVDEFVGPELPTPDAVASDSTAIQKQLQGKAASIKRKSANNIELNNDDLMFVAENLELFPRPETTGDQSGNLNVPVWFANFVQERAGQEAVAAKEFGRILAGDKDFSALKDVGFGRGPLTDSQIAGMASELTVPSMVLSPEQQAQRIAGGVSEYRYDRLAPQLEQSGVKPEEFEEYALKVTEKTVPDATPDAATRPVGEFQFGFADPVFTLEHLSSELDKMGVTQAEKEATIAAFKRHQQTGDIDERGRANPKFFAGPLLGKLDVAGMPRFGSELGKLVESVAPTYLSRREQSAKNFKDVVGKRYEQLRDAEGYLPWDADAKVGMFMWNAGRGAWDALSGIVDAIDFDNKPRQEIYKAMYRVMVVDRDGPRPLLPQEIELIEREANLDTGADVVDGAKEFFSRAFGFVTGDFEDTRDAFLGDPVGTLAQYNAIARSASFLSALGVPKNKISAFQRKVDDWLAKTDAHLTGIPLAIGATKLGLKGVGKTVDALVPESAQMWARGFFTSPTRVELAVKRARDQGPEVAKEVEVISNKVEDYTGKGSTDGAAVEKAMSEVSPKAAEFYARQALEEWGIGYGGDGSFVKNLNNPQEVLSAILSGDMRKIRDALPEQVLRDAGIKPAMTPTNMSEASGTRYTTIEMDPTVLSKMWDDTLAAMNEVDRAALISQINALRGKIGKRTLKHPFVEPPSSLKEGSKGVPDVFDQNKGISNKALLIAMLQEADGKPIPVTVLADDVTYFQGPLVGPPEIISKIPKQDRTRLPIYETRTEARAPELVEMLENGTPTDFALYLKRAEKLRRTPEAQQAFEVLKSRLLEKWGISEADWNKTRLGGLAANADGAISELVVRSAPRTPGAPEGVPAAVMGVDPPVPVVTREGREAAAPPTTIEADPTLTTRMREAVRRTDDQVFDAETQDIERMAQAKPEPVNVVTEAMVNDATANPGAAALVAQKVRNADTPTDVEMAFMNKHPDAVEQQHRILQAEAVERARSGQPVFPQDENASVLKRVMTAKSDAEFSTVSKALAERQAVAKSVRNKMLEDNLSREKEIGDLVTSGASWPEGTRPLVFGGTVDDVAGKLVANYGQRGVRYVERMNLQDAAPETRKVLNAAEGEKIVVPRHINEAMIRMSQLDDLMTGPYADWIKKYVGGSISAVKRALTTRGLIGAPLNFLSATFLRTLAHGRVDPTSIVTAMDDVKTYVSNPDKLTPEKKEMLRVMDDEGVFSSTVLSQEVINKGLQRMPSEAFADWLSGKPLTRPLEMSIRAWNKLLDSFERGYNLTDPVFKVDHVMHFVPKWMRAADKMEAGKFVDINTGKKLTVRIFKDADGNFRLGSLGGRVVPTSEVRKYFTQHATRQANDTWFDYQDVPGFMNYARKTGADLIALPILPTYSWKALHIPGVKPGLQNQITYGADRFNTNSPAFISQAEGSRMTNEALRQAVLMGGGALGRDERFRTPEAQRVAARFFANEPVSVFSLWGPEESYHVRWTGADPTSDQVIKSQSAVSALVTNKEALLKDKIAEPGVGERFIEKSILNQLESLEKADKAGTEKHRVMRKANELILKGLEGNPDYLKDVMRTARNNSAFFGADAGREILKVANFDEPAINQISSLEPDKERTVGDVIEETIYAALIGSQGGAQAAKGLKQMLAGERSEDVLLEVLRTKKVNNRRLNNVIKRITDMQRNNIYRDQNIFDDPQHLPAKRLENAALREIYKIAVAVDEHALQGWLNDGFENAGIPKLFKGKTIPGLGDIGRRLIFQEKEMRETND